MSPDSSKSAFIRNLNLWVRDVASGQEKALTTDGVENFGYATDNAGWAGSDRPILLWSPDSKKIATAQQDERKVGDMFLVETKVGHPTLKAWKYPLPGDSVVAMLSHVIIDVDAGRVTRVQLPPQVHRGTIGDNITLADSVITIAAGVRGETLRRLAYISPSFPADFTTRIDFDQPVSSFKHRMRDKALEIIEVDGRFGLSDWEADRLHPPRDRRDRLRK